MTRPPKRARLVEVASPLSDAVDALARAGATVVEGWPDGVDPERTYESFGFHVQLFFAFQQPGEDFATLSAVIEHEARRMAARAAWNRYFDEIDVFLCPANFTPAFPHDTRPFDGPHDRDAGRGTALRQPGLLGLARLAAGASRCRRHPIGRTAGGLPVGAQIIGPLYEDDTADHLRRTAGGRRGWLRTSAPVSHRLGVTPTFARRGTSGA